jgi:hypothetical protein
MPTRRGRSSLCILRHLKLRGDVKFAIERVN